MTGEPREVSPLISVPELALRQGEDGGLRLLDVRWSLSGQPGRELYRAGHIPGAVYVDLDGELSRPGLRTEGRHPLPELAALQSAARAWGINPGDTVVVYDGEDGLSAARAWWLLRYAGLSDVRLLDGSLPGWLAAGHSLSTGDEIAVPGTVELRYGNLLVLSMDDAAGLPAKGVLLDARVGERFRGEVEPIDPKAGHIPGAKSAPAPGDLDGNGRFLSAARLRERYTALGVREDTPVGVYCGSGVHAAHAAIALTIAGFRPALFPGSWSQWTNHPDRPIAVGG